MQKKAESIQGGFTLLEVMIALAVISISLTVLLHSQNANITRSHNANCLIKATLLSQKVMSEIDIEGKLSEGEWEGIENINGIDYSWKKIIEPAIVKGMKKITVKVWWDEKGFPLTVETFRAT